VAMASCSSAADCAAERVHAGGEVMPTTRSKGFSRDSFRSNKSNWILIGSVLLFILIACIATFVLLYMVPQPPPVPPVP
jgi:type IV secretory pathway component VirB8